MRQVWKRNSTPIEVTLLDDAVYNESFKWPDRQIQGQVLNVDQMEGPRDGEL